MKHRDRDRCANAQALALALRWPHERPPGRSTWRGFRPGEGVDSPCAEHASCALPVSTNARFLDASAIRIEISRASGLKRRRVSLSVLAKLESLHPKSGPKSESGRFHLARK